MNWLFNFCSSGRGWITTDPFGVDNTEVCGCRFGYITMYIDSTAETCLQYSLQNYKNIDSRCMDHEYDGVEYGMVWYKSLFTI